MNDNYTVSGERDAEETVKFAILNALSESYGKPPEKRRDAVFENLMEDYLKWALQELVCNVDTGSDQS